MQAAEILMVLKEVGATVRVNGDALRVEPRSRIPAELVPEIRRRKFEIMELLTDQPGGDGQAPPLDRPPQTEQELRRLIDHLADPEAFQRWFEWAMSYKDPAEE